MSEKGVADRLPDTVLIDADVLFSYLVADKLVLQSEKLLSRSNEGLVRLLAASEVYDDIITALRSSGTAVELVIQLLTDLRKIPHEVLPTTLDVALEAAYLYSRHGGSRKLHYFDAFHVATAKQHELPLVTSDRYILRHSSELGITSLNLERL